jgi:hypothetical protein
MRGDGRKEHYVTGKRSCSHGRTHFRGRGTCQFDRSLYRISDVFMQYQNWQPARETRTFSGIASLYRSLVTVHLTPSPASPDISTPSFAPELPDPVSRQHSCAPKPRPQYPVSTAQPLWKDEPIVGMSRQISDEMVDLDTCSPHAIPRGVRSSSRLKAPYCHPFR